MMLTRVSRSLGESCRGNDRADTCAEGGCRGFGPLKILDSRPCPGAERASLSSRAKGRGPRAPSGSCRAMPGGDFLVLPRQGAWKPWTRLHLGQANTCRPAVSRGSHELPPHELQPHKHRLRRFLVSGGRLLAAGRVRRGRGEGSSRTISPSRAGAGRLSHRSSSSPRH